MNILLIATGFYPYIIQLALALQKKEELSHITLIVDDKVNPEMLSLLPSSIKVIRFENILYKSIRANSRMFLSLIKNIRKIKPEIIHIQSYGHSWFYLLKIFLLFRVKIINTIHDPIPHSGDLITLKSLKRLKSTKQIHDKLTSKAIVHGKILKKDLLITSKFRSKNIHVIPHGELSIYEKLKNNNSSINHNNYILFFGRIWAYKGLDIFIDAALKLLEKQPHITFMIAGKGEDIDKYISIIPNNRLNNFIIINDKIDDSQISHLFYSCNFTVLPYKDATQSGVIPVAFVLHKTVIATKVGSLTEVIEDQKNGLLVPPNDSEALYKSMDLLISDTNLKSKLEKGAYETSQGLLNWDLIADKTIHCYKEALCVE